MLLSKEELLTLSVPCQEVREWLDANPQPSRSGRLDVLESRAMMQGFETMGRSLLGPPCKDIIEFEMSVTMRDGTTSPILVHKPSNPSANGSPVFVLFFGGGFVGGSRYQFLFRARALVKLLGAVCVCVSYRLAPEHPFPTAQMDAWDHTKWIADNVPLFGGDPRAGFVLGGPSAGASIAAVLTRRAVVVEPLPYKITGQWLEIPGIFGSIDMVPEQYRAYWLSREQCADGPLLSTQDYNAFAEASQWDPASSWYTPVAFGGSYNEMPPTYFAVDGADPLRDDALIYEEMLKQDGVSTRLDLYPGCPHAHTAFMRGTKIASKGLIESLQGAAWLVGREVSTSEVLASLPAMNGASARTLL